MNSVGILTFHASHNFGSVMQAWSTMTIIKNMGEYDVEIINFRPKSQKDKYSVFPIKSGLKVMLQNIVNARFLLKKYYSHAKYERFINLRLNTTIEINETKDLKALRQYDIYLSGSDQIWGYNIPEFVTSTEEIRDVYYFNFAKGYKISYGSSTSISTKEELERFKQYLKDYAYISVREESGQKIIQALTDKTVQVVLDPTYLIPHAQWVNIANKIPRVVEGDYYLIYSLQGLKKARHWKELIRTMLQKENTKFVTIVPFAPIDGSNIVEKTDAGPEEILNLFANAKFIFTDTFHGLSFSIHFRKPFVLYETHAVDYRKRNILDLFSLVGRETTDLKTCIEMASQEFSYDRIEPIIEEAVEKSERYLRLALTSFSSYDEENSI